MSPPIDWNWSGKSSLLLELFSKPEFSHKIDVGEIVIIDQNGDDKFTLGVDKITDSKGRNLNLQSGEVARFLKDLKVTSLGKIKSLMSARSYLSNLRGVREGDFSPDKALLGGLQNAAREAGIPTSPETDLKDASEAGLKSLFERAEEAVDRNDFDEMWRLANKMNDFAKEAGVSPNPLREDLLNYAKEVALQQAEENASRGVLLGTVKYLMKAKKCADEIGNPIDPGRAWKILIPLCVNKMWEVARKGDDLEYADAIRTCTYNWASDFDIDPLSFQYTVERAWKMVNAKASELDLKAAALEISKASPRLTVVLSRLSNARKEANEGGVPLDEKLERKIQAKLSAMIATEYFNRAIDEMGKMNSLVGILSFLGL